MQFPTIPSQKITVSTRPGVAGVSGVSAAPPSVPGQLAVAGAGLAQAAAQPPEVALPPVERRDGSRRDGPDRRRRQVAVLLDTRTGRDRRGDRRRTDDPAPFRLDDAA